MLDLSVFQWVILGLSMLLIGISKTGVPGIGILAILLTAAVIPAKQSTGLILPMLIVGDIFAVAYYRRHAVWKHLAKLMPFAAIGVILGYLAMGRINDTQLRVFIGLCTLAMLGLNCHRNRRGQDLPAPSAWWFPVIIGLIGGVVTMLANAAGPIMIIYLLAMRLPKHEFIGTGAWYYLLLNCFKVPFSQSLDLINLQSLQFNLVLLPMLMLGALVGVKLLQFIPQKTFGRIVQGLAALAALWLMISATFA